MVAEGVFSTGRISSYCSVEDVFAVLRGYDLAGFGGEAGLADRVWALLPSSRSAVESLAGRDFFHHVGEEVLLDGSGSSQLNLGQGGVQGPVQVQAVEVNDWPLESGEYRVYSEAALVRLSPGARWLRFPRGVQNVRVVLDWGPETPPEEVVLAQAKLAAAELLGELGGEASAVVETRIGDYAVRYDSGGRFSGAISRLLSEARETLRRYRRLAVGTV
jgi:hypothetical protein